MRGSVDIEEIQKKANLIHARLGDEPSSWSLGFALIGQGILMLTHMGMAKHSLRQMLEFLVERYHGKSRPVIERPTPEQIGQMVREHMENTKR